MHLCHLGRIAHFIFCQFSVRPDHLRRVHGAGKSIFENGPSTIAAWFSWAVVSSREFPLLDFHYIGYHNLFYPALDLLIVAGFFRDLVVDGRVNKNLCLCLVGQ
jgi:hypothetical protein